MRLALLKVVLASDARPEVVHAEAIDALAQVAQVFWDAGVKEVERGNLLGEEPLYEKCRDCHLFVEPNDAWSEGSNIAPFIHLARGNASDERLEESHEPMPSGMRANLATWKVFGPVLMRERFVNPTEWTDW